jgi:hypothetical protein
MFPSPIKELAQAIAPWKRIRTQWIMGDSRRQAAGSIVPRLPHCNVSSSEWPLLMTIAAPRPRAGVVDVKGAPELVSTGHSFDKLRRCSDGRWRFYERLGYIDTRKPLPPPQVPTKEQPG